ncbi:18061_t:CDS:1 [Racocetra fulgida]|uniref:18061_t:CDS:1 n=1 Tax=Racocetra fulgida TaxID=60492 RepID=A0A9N9GHL8_9GLOM|nr:18061_t:CDS:1 [Racocetra fulgida]
MEKKKIYVETIGIARKAINIAIETDDSQVLRFLKEYIIQKRHSLVENTTGVSHLGHEANILKECSKSNIIETLPPTNISNPIKKVRKGRPPKMKCYQSSLEKQPSRSKGKQHKLIHGPGTNTCGECGGKGHNRRWHIKHENKNSDLSTICQLCGDRGHKKGLHDHDYTEINDENEWTGSSDTESTFESDNDNA